VVKLVKDGKLSRNISCELTTGLKPCEPVNSEFYGQAK